MLHMVEDTCDATHGGGHMGMLHMVEETRGNERYCKSKLPGQCYRMQKSAVVPVCMACKLQ